MLGRSHRQRAVLGHHLADKPLSANADAKPRLHSIVSHRHSMIEPMTEYGRADLIQELLGLSPSVGQKLAAIITFAGSIEYHLERALWKLRRIDPKGVKPDTDARMITDLI